MKRLSRRELKSSPFPALPHYISINNAGVDLSEAACDLKLSDLPACLGRSGFSFLKKEMHGLPAWFPAADVKRILCGKDSMLSVRCSLTLFLKIFNILGTLLKKQLTKKNLLLPAQKPAKPN